MDARRTASSTPATSVAESQYLDMDLAQLMRVTIASVSKRFQVLVDTVAAAFMDTQEDIRRFGVTSMREALGAARGIQVACISSNKKLISSRVFCCHTSQNLLVLRYIIRTVSRLRSAGAGVLKRRGAEILVLQ
jgi:outer membrane receptor for ferrienterochelin and colicin